MKYSVAAFHATEYKCCCCFCCCCCIIIASHLSSTTTWPLLDLEESDLVVAFPYCRDDDDDDDDDGCGETSMLCRSILLDFHLCIIELTLVTVLK